MYCAKCGARLADGVKKCDECGNAVRVRPAVASGKRSEIAFDYAPGNLNKADNSKEKSGDYFPVDQEVKDPAFCEEPGENVDVQSIIRIAHGEEPASKKESSDPEDGKKPASKKESSDPEDGKKPVSKKKVSDSENGKKPASKKKVSDSENGKKPVSKKKSSDSENGKKPVPKKTVSNPEEGKRPVISNGGGRLRYGAVTPLEKVRRRIAEIRHHLEETAEEKRMSRHIERAARHYEELGAPATPILISSVKKTGESRKTAVDAVIPAQEAKLAASGHEEKVRAQQEKQTRETGGQAEHEKTVDILSSKSEVTPSQENVPTGQKAHAEYAEAAGQAVSKEEIPDTEATAELGIPERKVSAEAGTSEREVSAEGAAPEREVSAEAGTPEREVSAEGPAPEIETATESEALQGEAAGRKAVEEKILAEQKARAEQKVLADREAAEREAVERKAAEEKILAEQKARKALEEQERRDRERLARKNAAVAERTLSEEEKQLQEARRIRRYYEEEPDAMDLFLDKFGLTKETGVKIATLFLVVVLSLIYVIGRGRSGGSSSPSPSGEGAAGETFSVSPESEDDGDSGVFDDSNLPTGGGDFENSQSDKDTDAQQEGPDTQEPTENEAP